MLDVGFVLALAGLVGVAAWVLWRRAAGAAGSTLARVVRVATVVVVSVLVAGYASWALSGARSFQVAGRLLARVDTGQKAVALTFDDGPTDEYTPLIIDELRKHHAKATFFVVGQAAAQAPEALRHLVDAGHQIGNHTWSYPRLLGLSLADIADEVEKTDAVIRAAGFAGPIVVRPPNGKRLMAAPWYLAEKGRTTVMWSLEPDSIEGIADDPQAMRTYVSQRVRPGDIILLHVMYPARSASRTALSLILDDLEASGYRCVTVQELESLAGS